MSYGLVGTNLPEEYSMIPEKVIATGISSMAAILSSQKVDERTPEIAHFVITKTPLRAPVAITAAAVASVVIGVKNLLSKLS